MSDDRYLLSSVNNSLKIIDLLSEKPELGTAEISRELGIGKTSVFRMLYTLEKNDFVTKDKNSKYRLSIKFARFGNRVLDRIDIVSIVKPHLKELTNKHNETTHMAILSEDFNTIFLYKETSNSTFQMASNIGVKLPAYNTATVKVFLAGSDENTLNQFFDEVKLKEYTKTTITKEKELRKEIEEIKEKGYGIDNEESEEGLMCFAAPIKNISNKTVAAISISGPAFRMKENKDELIKSIIKVSNEISAKIGYKDFSK